MHLNEDQLVAIVSGVADDAQLQHERNCGECGSAVEDFKQQIEDARVEHMRAADRGERFWLQQQAAIRQRARLAEPRVTLPRWAVAVAALVVLATGLVTAGPSAPTVAHSQQSDPDYQLLVAVEQNLARPVPVAVEPARVLSADLNAAWQNAFAPKNSQPSAAQR